MAYHSKYSGAEVDALLDKIKDDEVGRIDSSLSTTSDNPVQNKVITEELKKKANKTDIATINGQSLTNGGNIEVVTDAYDDTEIKGKLTELEEKIDTKQDALNAGQGISIDQDTKTISCTLDTTIFKVVDSLPTAPASGDENKIHLVLSSSSEEGNTYDEYLWTNDSWERIGSFRPSVDLSGYAEKSYVDSQIKDEATARTKADAALKIEIDNKQEALTLTVKDNGNIVLANIQGQSKEFMPATPSGDPMHYAYVTAGAEYNDTGADILKDTPWADMVDDDYTGDYGKTVVHKAGYWYLNGLGDLTTDEIRKIYTLTSSFPESLSLDERMRNYNIKTNFYSKSFIGGMRTANCFAMLSMSNLIVFRGDIQAATCNYAFHSPNLVHIIGTMGGLSGFIGIFYNISFIETFKIVGLSGNIVINSPNLSVKSVLYMINKENATSPIAITLHKTVYDRCMANADILAALQAHANVSLASA